ncbi:hypothetical protein BAE44_0023509 [Dichanthelium oligosanthes]|uniref:Uncharacterized protein n=1 Tax=Dichanthelium oligosanthes TaxID=888268 RepID=A0A1E5URI5_9POAL|nr:hypothetical protein BAE44_0023509 [Dichanthelium oligosanthes]
MSTEAAVEARRAVLAVQSVELIVLEPPPPAPLSAASSPRAGSSAATGPSTPHVLGGIVSETGDFHPAEPPHRSAPAARAVARAADFTFSFLPKPSNRWHTSDVRVLLSASASSLEDLVIFDPLHRRYVLIPSIPGDQVASVRHFFDDKQEFEPFLVPAAEEEKESYRPSERYAMFYPNIRW